MDMTKAEAARILDPETSREALAFLSGRPHIIDTLKQEACRMGAYALRYLDGLDTPLTQVADRADKEGV